jgi:hypothetical protein
MVISDRTKGCCSSDLNKPRTLTMTNLLNLTHTTWARIHRKLKRKHVALSLLRGRVQRGAAARTWLLPLLRALPELGAAALGENAADPRGRRQAVRRLCRRHGTGDRFPPPDPPAKPATALTCCRGRTHRAARRVCRLIRCPLGKLTELTHRRGPERNRRSRSRRTGPNRAASRLWTRLSR